MRASRTVGFMFLLSLGLGMNAVRADSVLVADTSLVSGNQSSVFSFDAPGPGIVTVEIANLDWPQPLKSLSFVAGTPTQVFTSWSDPVNALSANLTFQVAAGGNFFADVTAQAGGALDLGLYSLCIRFTPTVPLPATGGLLLAALIALLALRHVARSRRLLVEAAAG